MSEDHPVNDPSQAETLPPEKPFLIELKRLDRQPSGYFRPHASVSVSPRLRTSGLLAALPPDELKSLLFMLTFVHPNGHCIPSLTELSQAMRVSQFKAQSRMRRLSQFRWIGEPIAVEISRENGLDAFSPSPRLVDVREMERRCPHCGSDLTSSPPDSEKAEAARQQRREQIVSSSRERYARPRAEVERTIARMMGWVLPDRVPEAPNETAPDAAEAMVRQRLAGVGVSREQVDFLLAQFELDAVRNQLEWLTYRKAKNRAAFLVAAIENNYEAPLALRAIHPPQEAEATAADERKGNDEGV